MVGVVSVGDRDGGDERGGGVVVEGVLRGLGSAPCSIAVRNHVSSREEDWSRWKEGKH